MPESDAHPVFINVGGLVYETRSETLNKYPDTLLGDDTKRVKYFCPYRNEYFFNRHRESFASILFFYQSSGKLCRPGDINLKVFIEECEFFQLPQWAIKFMKRKEGGFLEDDIFELLTEKKTELTTFRSKFWNFFEDPSSSKYARRFAYFYICLLSVSIVINCLKTVKELRPRLDTAHEHDLWEIGDITINTYFLIEFIARLIISPSKKQFFQRLLVWIDLIALVTFIPLLNKHYTNESVVLFFTPFQLFRVVRIFRLAKILPGFNVTEIILRNSVGDLKVFAYCLLFLVTLGGTILFNIENKEKDTTFTSVPVSMYWAIQTFVTLGYGDMVPTTPCGKLFAAAFIIGFIPTLSVPVLSIIVKFSTFYEFYSAISE